MYALDRSGIKGKDWTITKKLNENLTARIQTNHGYTKKLRKRLAYVKQGWGQVQYLYLSTYLSVLDVLEYLVYGNVKVLVLVLVLDQKVLGTYK